MARIRDEGHVAAADKPIRLPVYGPHATDPHQLGAGAIYYVNDKRDGIPRGRIAAVNGATEDLVAYVDDVAVLEANIKRVEQIALAAASAPRADVAVTTVPSHEVEALSRRLYPLETALREVRGDVQTLQGGLRRLERARPDAAPVEAPDNSAVETPASFPDVTASLLPIERRLAQLEADYSNEVAYQMAYRYLSPDGIEKQLAAKWITAEAEAMGAEPEAYAQAIVKQRVDRHDAVMAQRLAAIRGKA